MTRSYAPLLLALAAIWGASYLARARRPGLVFGVIYGALILDEPVGASALGGPAVVLGGVALGSGVWRPLRSRS